MIESKLRDANNIRHQNALKPFTDENWAITNPNKVRDVVKNDMEIGFKAVKANGFNHVIRNPREYTGKFISLSIEERVGMTGVSIWITTPAGTTNNPVKGNRLDGLFVPSNATSIRVKLENSGNDYDYCYFKGIYLTSSYYANGVTDYVESPRFIRNKIERYPSPEESMDFWRAGGILTTGSATPEYFNHEWDYRENAMRINYWSGSHHGASFLLPVNPNKYYRIKAKAKFVNKSSEIRETSNLYTNYFSFFGSDMDVLATNQAAQSIYSNWSSTLVKGEYREISITFKLSSIPLNARYFTMQFVRSGGSATQGDYILLKDLELISSNDKNFEEGNKSANENEGLLFDSYKRSFARTGDIPVTKEYTLSVKFKATKLLHESRVLWGYGTDRNILRVDSNGLLGWYTKIGDKGSGYQVYGSVRVGEENVATFRYNGNKVSLILNGETIHEYEATGLTQDKPINLGTNYNNSGSYFDGSIYFFKYFNRSLSDAEISSIEDLEDSSLITNYDFRRPQGTRVMRDFSGNGIDGEYYGAVPTIKSTQERKKPFKKYEFSFSRPSTEFINGSTFGLNQPRIVNDGVLIENELSNLLENPLNLTDSKWTKESWSGRIIDNAGIAPNGKLEASRVIHLEKHDGYLYHRKEKLSGATNYVMSAWMKSATGEEYTCPMFIWTYDGASGKGLKVASGEKVTSEWKRFELRYTSKADETSMSFGLVLDGTKVDILIWGSQLELDRLTEFTPSTRPQEKLDMPVVLDGEGGSIEVDFEYAETKDKLYLFDSNKLRWLLWKPEGKNYFEIYTNGNLKLRLPDSPFAIGRNKFAMKWNSNKVEAFVNNVKVGEGLHDGGSNTNTLYVGRRNDNTGFLNGVVYSFIVRGKDGRVIAKI